MTTPAAFSFISHATADDAHITRLAQKLKARGVDVWVDHLEGIPPGSGWRQEIQQALGDCRDVLLIISPQSATLPTRPEIESEWTHALNLGCRLYPLLLDKVAPRVFPYRLSVVNYLDLTRDEDAALDAVARAIKGEKALDPAEATLTRAPHITGPLPYNKLDLPLIGRKEQKDKITEWLTTDKRVATIQGLGGIGKSRLAAEVAVEWADRERAGGVVWHEITPDTTLDSLPQLLRDHFRLTSPDPEEGWQRLTQSRTLLVLDNAEDAPDAVRAEYVRRVNQLPQGAARVLLTSRVAWSKPTEFDKAPVKELKVPEPEDAEQILWAMLAQTRPDDEYRLPDVRALADAAHHHPRLMEYAVGWLSGMTIDEVSAEMRELRRTNSDVEEMLEEVIGRTVDKLEAEPNGPEALTVLRRLAVCRGGCTTDAAKAIGQIEDPALKGLLVRWTLLQLQGDRYAVDPLVRRHVGEDPLAGPVHYAYYRALAKQHDKAQDYLGLSPEADNLDAAVEWAKEAGELEKAYWLLNASSDFLQNRARHRYLLDQLESLRTALLPVVEEHVKAAFYVTLGVAYQTQPTGNRVANLGRAEAAFREALHFYTPEAAPLYYAMTQNNLAILYRNLSEVSDRVANLGRAETAYREALRFHTPEAAPLDYAATQNNLAVVYWNLSEVSDRTANLRRAEAAYREALRFRTPEAAPLDYAATQNNLGNTHLNLSEVADGAANLGRAEAAFREALRFYTPEAAPLDYATTQNNLAVVYRNLSKVADRAANLGRAETAFREALRFYTPEDAPLDYAMTQNNLGNVYRNLSEVSDRAANLGRAETAYREALRFYTPETFPLRYILVSDNLGKLCRQMGDAQRALTIWQAAEQVARQKGFPQEADEIRAAIQQLLASLDEPQEPGVG